MKKIMMMLTVSLFTGQLMAQPSKHNAPSPPPIHKTSKKAPLPPPPPPIPPVVKSTLPPPPPTTPQVVKAPKMPAPPPPPTARRTSKKLKQNKENIQFTPPVIVKDKEK